MPPHGPKAFLNNGHPSSSRRGAAAPYSRVPSGPRANGQQQQQQQQQQQRPATPRKKKGSAIMVSNLPGDVSNKDVVDLFVVTVGPLAGCRLVHNDQGRFEGIALVDFVEDGDALKAYTLYNNKMIDQQTPLKVSLLYTSPPPTPVSPSSSNPLFNLAPFPSQQSNNNNQPRQQSAPSKPKPKQLAARLGPAVVKLGDRLGPPPAGAAPSVVAKEVAGKKGGQQQAKKKSVAVLKKMKARGGKKGKGGGGGGGAQAMVL